MRGVECMVVVSRAFIDGVRKNCELARSSLSKKDSLSEQAPPLNFFRKCKALALCFSLVDVAQLVRA